MQQAKLSDKNRNVGKLKTRRLKRALLRAVAAREKKKREVLDLKEKLEKTSEECIEKYLGGLPSLQRLSLMTAFQQIKAKAPCGMRYSAEWLLNCMLVRIASPRAYKLINDLKMLPLPSMSRLTQILKGIPCKYGFNAISLEAIQKQMHNKAQHQTFGTLILDEIKLKQWYDFNKSTYKVDGFVDYGGVTKEGASQLADHALVFMFVPLFEGWVQPIASFATRSAAPGRVLAELVLEAVVQLHKFGATVLAVVSDGAGNNKSMWQQFSVSGGMVNTRHKIPHPCLPDGQYLHFICDVPHVIKCIRNHLLKHQYGQAGAHCINFHHYKILFETEREKHLKAAHKLTAAHVQPNNLQRMNVRLATQVIKDYLQMLNETERNHCHQNMLLFASRQTVESLRVTLLSVLDIIEELHKAGVTYVLTAKLNQDPLEQTTRGTEGARLNCSAVSSCDRRVYHFRPWPGIGSSNQPVAQSERHERTRVNSVNSRLLPARGVRVGEEEWQIPCADILGPE
ncbi:hypothetical protein HPB47_001513 [Ixodes persulcatus]|uniref:Uncharacterized protein n=1 Tax=Ixodes persulcatus TaxID=34615 RepID=A0AC60PP55_IXOPE|nr:hypothetical protein HPB47_001513 [Ixodes persulcatus]